MRTNLLTVARATLIAMAIGTSSAWAAWQQARPADPGQEREGRGHGPAQSGPAVQILGDIRQASSENTLRFWRNKPPQYGVAIKDFTLTPVK